MPRWLIAGFYTQILIGLYFDGLFVLQYLPLSVPWFCLGAR
jgi:hypothetical protein